MVRRAAAGVVLAVVAVGVLGLVLAGPGASAATEQREPPQTTPEEFTNAEFEIRVYGNGSATWTVRAGRPLENQTEVDRFREFAETFESTETETFQRFRVRAQRLTAFGTNATGREMNATGFSREARVDELGQRRGIVELSFLWTNFARSEDERVIVGDVFQGGMFVDDGQRLVIAHGPDVVFADVAPEPDSQSAEDDLAASETVTWIGQRDFPDRRPRVVLVPPELATGGTDEPADSATDGDSGDGGDGENGAGTATAGTGAEAGTNGQGSAAGSGGIGMLPFIIAVVLLLGLGGGFALYSGAVGDIRRQSGSAGDTVESVGASDVGASAEQPVPDEELLSDEDRVLQLLEENGGRMKQVNIVEETEWSKSKVSMLLSDMEEEELISKLRVGRENIISKAGEEPDAAGSPFEDE